MPLVAVPMEPGSTVPWTVLEEIRKASCTWTSTSGWVSAKVLVEAMALELGQARPHPFPTANPDPG